MVLFHRLKVNTSNVGKAVWTIPSKNTEKSYYVLLMTIRNYILEKVLGSISIKVEWHYSEISKPQRNILFREICSTLLPTLYVIFLTFCLVLNVFTWSLRMVLYYSTIQRYYTGAKPKQRVLSRYGMVNCSIFFYGNFGQRTPIIHVFIELCIRRHRNVKCMTLIIFVSPLNKRINKSICVNIS